MGPQRTCPQVQGLVGSVTQGVWGLGDIGRDWESRRAGIPERTRAHSFLKRSWGGEKWNMEFIFFELGRRARRVHALDLSMLASYYVKPQKFHPGPGYVLFVPVLSLVCVSYCVLPVSVSGSARDFCLSQISRIIPSPTKRFRYNTTCLLRMTYIS